MIRSDQTSVTRGKYMAFHFILSLLTGGAIWLDTRNTTLASLTFLLFFILWGILRELMDLNGQFEESSNKDEGQS